MNFKLLQKDLVAELNMISTINTKTLLLNENNTVKFELKNIENENHLEVSFFDNETSFIKKLKLKGDVNGSGTFYLPSKRLAGFFNSFPGCEIEFTKTEKLKNKISLKVNGYEIYLVEQLPNSPKILEIEDLPKKIVFSSAKLKEIIKSTLFCILDQKIRKNLMGMNIRLFEKNWMFIGSDSYRISILKIKDESVFNIEDKLEFENIIVAKKTLEDFLKILAPIENKNLVTLMFDDRQVLLKTEDIFFKSLLISDKYPDINRFFVKDENNFSEKMIVDKNELLLALRVFKNNIDSQTGEIFLTLSKGNLKLGFESDTGSISKEIDVISETKEKKLAFNINYLLDAVQSFASEELKFIFNDSESPVYIKNIKGEDYYHVIMPLRLDSNKN